MSSSLDDNSGQAATPQAGAVAEASRPYGRRHRLLARVALASAMTVVGLNIWTGAPLLALWVGSKAQGDLNLSMSSVLVVILVLAVLVFVLVRALWWLDLRYGRVIGRKAGTRQPHPWLKSVSGERVPKKRPREPLTPLERILVVIVVLTIGCFEVWFFFFAGSSLPGG